MKRIVWIAAALLVMIGIMSYGMYTMRHISQVNQQRREQEAAKDYAAKIVLTTETTDIWDKLRPTETESGEGESETATTEKSGVMRPAKPNSANETTEETADETAAASELPTDAPETP